MRANNVSPNTILAYGGAVRQFGRWLMAHDYTTVVAEIEPRHVDQWIGELLETNNPATAHNRWRGTQRFLNWYAEKDDELVPEFGMEALSRIWLGYFVGGFVWVSVLIVTNWPPHDSVTWFLLVLGATIMAGSLVLGVIDIVVRARGHDSVGSSAVSYGNNSPVSSFPNAGQVTQNFYPHPPISDGRSCIPCESISLYRASPKGTQRMRLRVRRPRYAEVAATLALFMSMAGTTYAVANTLPANSVDTQAIQDQAVTGPKIALDAVTGDRVHGRRTHRGGCAGRHHRQRRPCREQRRDEQDHGRHDRRR